METKEKKYSDETQTSENIKQGANQNYKEFSDEKGNNESNGKSQEEGDSKQQNDFWEDARENISEGAKIVGEKVNEYAHTIKVKAKEAFKTGSELTLEMVHKAQEIIDTYKHKQEIKRLSDERDEHFVKLGKHLYRTVKSIEYDLPENYLEETNVQSLINEIETIDKKIIQINEQEKESK